MKNGILDLVDHIKIAMDDKKIRPRHMGEMLQENPRVISVNLSRRRLAYETALKYANMLDCDIVLQDRKTGKIY